MEVFISFLAGFAIGWASVWMINTIPFLKDTEKDDIDYNNSSGRTLQEIVDSEFDPENYFKVKGTNNA